MDQTTRATTAGYLESIATELSAAVVSDVLDGLGLRDQAMTADLRPAFPGAVVVGRAHTMLSSDVYHLPENPYELEIAAIDSTPPDGVIVAATNGSTRTCLWGELLSTTVRAHGGRGAVIDGHIRDRRMIEEMGFPVFATGSRPVDSYGRGRVIAYGEPVRCGGVLVSEGDLVLGDVDGVVVVPAAVEEEVVALARRKVAEENEMRSWLSSGRTLREAFDHFGIL